jgi:hypothetical protein
MRQHNVAKPRQSACKTADLRKLRQRRALSSVMVNAALRRWRRGLWREVVLFIHPAICVAAWHLFPFFLPAHQRDLNFSRAQPSPI